MTRTDLINYIIKKKGYKSYLEIGLGNGENLGAIRCDWKVGVDPDPKVKISQPPGHCLFIRQTSDSYFKHHKSLFNIIFIDGLHHADQVRKDIINAWECLTDGGCLVIHDTNPANEDRTHVPCDNPIWNGDVYKTIHQIDGPPKFTLKDDHGVTVIRKTGPLVMSDGVIEWDGFVMFREAILHLVTWEEAIKIIDSWK